tara:strand:- start:685 stop:1146 length:462 start_codon:yes stop_codon:yes gene_type:complete
MDIDTILRSYKDLETSKINSIDELKLLVLKQKPYDKSIHHYGFIVPKNFSDFDFNLHCGNSCCKLNIFDAMLGYFHHHGIIIELIKPLSEKSILYKNFNSNSYRFDHMCFYDKKTFNENELRITKKIFTPLFKRYVSFHLLEKKYKIEKIYCQ